MGIADKIRDKVEQVRAELAGVNLPPSRAERQAENAVHEAAERQAGR